MGFPLTLDEYLYAVAKETARMSWPKRMSTIFAQGTKNDAEAYFTSGDFLARLKSAWRGKILAQNPYTITPEEHQFVQRQLRKLLRELNCRPNMEFKLTSPIQSNILWADGHKT